MLSMILAAFGVLVAALLPVLKKRCVPQSLLSAEGFSSFSSR